MQKFSKLKSAGSSPARCTAAVVKLVYTLDLGSNSARVRVQVPSAAHASVAQWPE